MKEPTARVAAKEIDARYLEVYGGKQVVIDGEIYYLQANVEKLARETKEMFTNLSPSPQVAEKLKPLMGFINKRRDTRCTCDPKGAGHCPICELVDEVKQELATVYHANKPSPQVAADGSDCPECAVDVLDHLDAKCQGCGKRIGDMVLRWQDPPQVTTEEAVQRIAVIFGRDSNSSWWGSEEEKQLREVLAIITEGGDNDR